MIKRTPSRCAHVKANGEQCQNGRLSKDGLQSMADAGIDLVADAAQFCSYHARSEASKFEMQSRAGSFSQKRAAERKQEKLEAAWEARETMPRELVIRAQQALRELLTAKLPGTRESDARQVATGAYVAAHLYGRPDDHDRLFHALLPRDLHARTDLREIAETELRHAIEELAPEDREAIWEFLATAS